jgi:PII-like signaling protein
MLEAGKALKVSIYVSEGATRNGAAVSSTVLDFLFFRGVAGATVLKGVAGFGADHHIHTSSSVEIAEKLPLKIEFVETEEKINELLPKLEELVGSGMIELQETRIFKPAQPSKTQAAPLSPVKIEGKARMMQIYIGESDRWQGKPLHEALVRALRANDLAGATVNRGIMGFGAHGRIRKDKPFRLSQDASITISVVDTEEKLRAVLPVIDGMVQEGLVALSDVDIIKYAHREAAVRE